MEGDKRWTPAYLFKICGEGRVDALRNLSTEPEALHDIQHARDDSNDTLLHVAALNGQTEVVQLLITEFHCTASARGKNGRSLMHCACEGGNASLVRFLVNEHGADVHARDDNNNTPLHYAASFGTVEVVKLLITEYSCDVTAKACGGASLLHCACEKENASLVRLLVNKHEADVHARDDNNHTPLHYAAVCGNPEVAKVLITEFGCDVKAKDLQGRSLLHNACGAGKVSMVWLLISNYGADIHARDGSNNTPLHSAAFSGNAEVVELLITVGSDITAKGFRGRSLLHSACVGGNVNLVRLLVNKYGVDIYARDDDNSTPLHYAARFGGRLAAKAYGGVSLVYYVYEGGNVSLVRLLVSERGANIHARDNDNHTPLHLAAMHGNIELAWILVTEFGSDASVKDNKGKTLLHYVCEEGNIDKIQNDYGLKIDARDNENNTPLHMAAFSGKEKVIHALVTEFKVSLLCINKSGDTPLHICSSRGDIESVKTILTLNPPILIRNNIWKTPITAAAGETKQLLQEYKKKNKEKIYNHYDKLQHLAGTMYSTAQNITRIFVIGNPGVGKSTLIENLKRETLCTLCLTREFSVQPNTAGIIPSTFTSKYYSRVLFYDFAGQPEYYSSNAAILENIACLTKGDNIFVIVADVRKDDESLYYWLSFIRNHKFKGSEPTLIIACSHVDLLPKKSRVIKRKKEMLSRFCARNGFGFHKVVSCLLDCTEPRSKEINKIQKFIVASIENSPHCKVTFEAYILLGLLKKDFSKVTACSIQTILSHIKDIFIHLPTDKDSLCRILNELHEIGLLYMVQKSEVILSISKLTNEVQEWLSSQETIRIRKCSTDSPSFNVGIIPASTIEETLPPYITKKCLIELQYCQEIKYNDVPFFPITDPSASSNQTFLFFPALCRASKNIHEWKTPQHFNYSIGWLARCRHDSYDFFPPRFLHVLLLRLVFNYSDSVPMQSSNEDLLDSCFLERRCIMWISGVRWTMEKGVECIVEFGEQSKDVTVVIKTEETLALDTISIFNEIIRCVMDTKAEFCHSVKPEFYFFNPTQHDAVLDSRNLFAMNKVKNSLMSPKSDPYVCSVTGDRSMKRSIFKPLLSLTYWNNLFPIDYKSVLGYLENVTDNLKYLGLELDINIKDIKKKLSMRYQEG